MLRQRWVRLERLFAEALALPEAARTAFLDHACGDDADLRSEIDALLRSHDAPGVLDTAQHPPHAVEPLPSLAPGTCLGPWRVGHMIGRGGMGEVYAATRADAAFEQRAALKLLRYEAVGEVERFHAERRILAKLEHPGIARLLDGGVAPDGRPYTVMEHVEGRSLTDYCHEHRASLRQRLALFAQVCDAVAFAHRNLVIHRDLKPANILVDDEGKVKLLDFGIAKLLDAAAVPGDTDVTIAPFTPDYAAPEQLSGQPVTTATDIYALGVLLFELLTGERPLRMRGLPSAHALKLLLDRNPPPPSRIAQANAEAPLPARLLVGDLDAIVAKCLRKEAGHRYETVNGLKRDIERHLHNEPVSAREGARLYVVGRLLRRYRWAVAGVAVLIVTLAAGLAGTAWQAQRAETQARTAVAAQDFLSDLFKANSSSQKDPVMARQTTARELLDLGAKEIDTAMADAPAAKLSMLWLLGQLYDDLALPNEEVHLYRQAVNLTRSLYGADAPELAAALIELAGAMHGSDDARSDLEATLREAEAILARDRDQNSEIRGRLLLKQVEFYQTTNLPLALDYANRSVRLFQARPPSEELSEAWYLQGLIQSYSGRLPEAVVSLKRAIDVSRLVQGVPNPRLPILYYQLAETQGNMPDFAGAEHSARLALRTALAINGENHVDAVRTRMKLGDILLSSGRMREALDLLAIAKLQVLKLRGADDPYHTPAVLFANGRAQARAGNLDTGLPDIEAALANLRRKEPKQLFAAVMLEEIATTLIEMGRIGDAKNAIGEAANIRESIGQARGTEAFNGITDLRSRLALAEGNMSQARDLLDELVIKNTQAQNVSRPRLNRLLLEAAIALAAEDVDTVAKSVAGVRAEVERNKQTAYMQSYLATANLLEGKAKQHNHDAAAALPLLQHALTTRERMLVASSPKIAEAQIALAECFLAMGQVSQSRSLAVAASEIHATHKALGEQYRRPLRQLQAGLATAQ